MAKVVIAMLLLCAALPGQRVPRVLKQAERLRPGTVAVERLSRMTPQQRERALARMPAERRQRLEKNLDEFQKLPQVQQDRLRSRVQLLNDLPQERQNMVRRSMREFNQMQPGGRKMVLNRELRRMAPMPAEERRAYLTSEGFKGRFSSAEQALLGDLVEIMPAGSQD